MVCFTFLSSSVYSHTVSNESNRPVYSPAFLQLRGMKWDCNLNLFDMSHLCHSLLCKNRRRRLNLWPCSQGILVCINVSHPPCQKFALIFCENKGFILRHMGWLLLKVSSPCGQRWYHMHLCWFFIIKPAKMFTFAFPTQFLCVSVFWLCQTKWRINNKGTLLTVWPSNVNSSAYCLHQNVQQHWIVFIILINSQLLLLNNISLQIKKKV